MIICMSMATSLWLSGSDVMPLGANLDYEMVGLNLAVEINDHA